MSDETTTPHDLTITRSIAEAVALQAMRLVSSVDLSHVEEVQTKGKADVYYHNEPNNAKRLKFVITVELNPPPETDKE